ncbi:ecotin family protein [Synechococcus sp. MIT S9508]|uniref:ecotin family protein n=1 Tax=Synechococcus sp. MIT S9508 TaxID=1801629 RepID=UPI0007BB6BB1|nr:ecotin family protein [Synechococcus sp. MIT S9508]KZR90331.1 Ecotin precursor [Synechococcus sp. MIT S9508]
MTKPPHQLLNPIACFGAALSLFVLAALPGVAIPRLNLTGYPEPAPGLKRWVIQPSGLLPKSTDPLISAHPLDWRIQLIVGQTVSLDCNTMRLSGSGMTMRMLPKASGKSLFEVKGPVAVISTKMACPDDQPTRTSFLSLGKQPYLVPYNASWPIVVDLPVGTELRWRVWKAETRQQMGVQL